jgi:hypothetical protein
MMPLHSFERFYFSILVLSLRFHSAALRIGMQSPSFEDKICNVHYKFSLAEWSWRFAHECYRRPTPQGPAAAKADCVWIPESACCSAEGPENHDHWLWSETVVLKRNRTKTSFLQSCFKQNFGINGGSRDYNLQNKQWKPYAVTLLSGCLGVLDRI